MQEIVWIPALISHEIWSHLHRSRRWEKHVTAKFIWLERFSHLCWKIIWKTIHSTDWNVFVYLAAATSIRHFWGLCTIPPANLFQFMSISETSWFYGPIQVMPQHLSSIKASTDILLQHFLISLVPQWLRSSKQPQSMMLPSPCFAVQIRFRCYDDPAPLCTMCVLWTFMLQDGFGSVA